MKTTTVKSLWIDSTLGELQIICLKSFLAQGIEVHLYTYGEIINAPEGVVIKDAGEVLLEKYVFKDNRNSYATFSDWFRIKLLYDLGGWWVDCDVLCIKPFLDHLPYVFATERCVPNGTEDNLTICNAVIKMPAGSSLANGVLNQIAKKLEADNVLSIKWTEIGANLLLEGISSEQLEDFVVAPEVFCPNDFLDFRELINRSDLTIDENTFGIHLWNKMWEWSDIDPLSTATDKSIIGNAIKKFL